MKKYLWQGTVLTLSFCAVPFTSWLAGNDIFVRGANAVGLFWSSCFLTAVIYAVFELFDVFKVKK